MGEKTASIKTIFATDKVSGRHMLEVYHNSLVLQISTVVAIAVSAALTYFSYNYYNTYWISTEKLTVFTFLSIITGSACGYTVLYFNTINVPPSSTRRSIFILSSMSTYAIVFGIAIIWRQLDTWGAYLFLILLPSMATLWSWRRMKAGVWAIADPRGTRIRDGHMVVSRAQIKEIDISQPANALGFLRFTDYTLGMLCVLIYISPASLVFFILLMREESIFGPTIALILLFATYTGWRNMSVIDVRIWPAYLFLCPLFLLSSALLVRPLFIIPGTFTPLSSMISEEPWPYIVFVIIWIWVTLLAIVGFLSVLFLKRMRVASIGIPLVALLCKLCSSRVVKVSGARRIKRINTAAGIAFLASGFVILLFAPVFGIVSLLGFFLLIKARSYFQARADSLLSTDRRNPILFLRSFYDDQKQRVDNAAKAIVDFSLEVRLANHFSYFGPFIAVGSPIETVPQLGAARVMLSEDEWQSRVMKWIAEASLIIMYAGKTQWVNWELGKIIEAERVKKLILIIPEIRGFRDRSKEIHARMERVKDAFKDTIWSTSLATLQNSGDIRAVLFDSDGSLVVLKSRPRNRDSYHLGVLIAHFLMINNIRDFERKE